MTRERDSSASLPSSQPVLLGVDGGGTQTRALVVTPDGRRSEGRAGPANWTTLGPERCIESVIAAAQAALTQLGLRMEDLDASCIALAGYYPPWHRSQVEALLGAALPGVALRVEPDLIAAWTGATAGEPGVVLIAGTGSVAFARDAHARSARAGGWGPLFGDEGGGYWIGCEALRAVARALDGRGDPTALVSTLACRIEVASAGTPSPGEVEAALRTVYRDAWTREQVASIAESVSSLAAKGDHVCLLLLERAATELAALVVAVAERLSWTDAPLVVVPVGGLFAAGPGLRLALEQRLAGALPHAVWQAPRGSPVEGALQLAKETSG